MLAIIFGVAVDTCQC